MTLRKLSERRPILARCSPARIHGENTPDDECIVEVLWTRTTLGRDGVEHSPAARVRCVYTREQATVPLGALVSL